MSVNEKMTLLADAVRAKSGATGKLSIDGMTTAVNSITVGGSGGTTVTLGQVNADGNFQALAFSGTEASNSGDPEAVENYYTYNGVLPVPECGKGGGSGGGSADYYKCAYVHHRSPTKTVIKVTGAGYTFVNGVYRKTELLTPFGGEVWQKYSALTGALEDFYLYNYADNAWAIGLEYDGIPQLFDYYSINGIVGNYRIFLSDDYAENLPPQAVSRRPPPTLSSLTLEGPETLNTWNGYKAIWVDKEGYSFEETVTEGLTYGSALTPKPGGIYDGTARIEVSKLFEAVKPITTNDTSCLIYIDGTTLANQGRAPNKHDVTFGSGVSLKDGYVITPNDSSGGITTTAQSDGYGGALSEWTWDFYFVSDGTTLEISGHTSRGWCIMGGPGGNLHFRDGGEFDVPYNANELVGMSLQYDNGVIHVWSKGVYKGSIAKNMPNCAGEAFGIGWNAVGDYDRMTDKIKLFRFSNKARYTPGVDFELPEGFIE